MKLAIFLCLMAIAVILVSLNALACGCGMALAPPEVFNSMKESQAYLLVDVTGPDSYVEKPFFRFVSLDRPYDVKMVFPMKELPAGVEGKKLSIKEFMENEKIGAAKTEETKQNLAEAVNAVRRPLVIPAIISGAGIGGSFLYSLSFLFTTVGSGAGRNKEGDAIASYSFEGGQLDIYDVSGGKTLDTLVKELGFEASGKVKELVDKYSDYYAAVMTLNVPTALSPQKMDYLKNNCGPQFESAKALLRTKTTIEWKDLGIDQWKASKVQASGGGETQDCESMIIELVSSATSPSSEVKGVMVSMKYNSKEIFYPTSIVNSYEYPVTDQAYYVKTPTDLQFSTETPVSGKILLESTRWYIIKDPSEDMAGRIEPASAQTKAEDAWLMAVKTMYENSGWIALILFIAMAAMAVRFVSGIPKEDLPPMNNLIIITLLAGVIIGVIYAFVKGKRKFAAMLFLTWAALLLIAIL